MSMKCDAQGGGKKTGLVLKILITICLKGILLKIHYCDVGTLSLKD